MLVVLVVCFGLCVDVRSFDLVVVCCFAMPRCLCVCGVLCLLCFVLFCLLCAFVCVRVICIYIYVTFVWFAVGCLFGFVCVLV